MFRSIDYMDYDIDNLVNETLTIGQMSKGSMTYSDLLNMPFDIYEKIVKVIIHLQSETDGK